jgi:hypothetical protein
MNPLSAFVQTHKYWLQGRLHFPRSRVGSAMQMPDGRTYTIFRQVIVDPASAQTPAPDAIFQVKFRVAGMPPWLNKRFSWLPIPFFVGLPGFRSKFWMLDEVTGEFQGLYRWQTVEDAENYANSFAMKFMTRRAVPESITYQIAPVSEGEKNDELYL